MSRRSPLLALQLHATEKPGVWLIESETKVGTEYIMHGVGTPFLTCSCPQMAIRGTCKHYVAVMEATLKEYEMISENPTLAEDEVGRALVPILSGTVMRADQKERAAMLREAAASYTAGYAAILPYAAAMVDAKLVPGTMNSAQAALVIMKGLELAIPPTTAFEFLYVVDGKIKIQGQMVQALIQRANAQGVVPGRIDIVESDAKHCVAVGHRAGYPDLRIEWTYEMAVQAKLTGRFGWQQYPQDMLRWKAVARIGRLMFADVLGGMDVADLASGEVIDSTAVIIEAGHSNAEMPVDNQVEPFAINVWTQLRKEPEFRDVKGPEIASFIGAEKLDANSISGFLSRTGRSMRELLEGVKQVRGSSRPRPNPPPDLPISHPDAEPPDVTAARQQRFADDEPHEGEYRDVAPDDPDDLPFR